MRLYGTRLTPEMADRRRFGLDRGWLRTHMDGPHDIVSLWVDADGLAKVRYLQRHGMEHRVRHALLAVEYHVIGQRIVCRSQFTATRRSRVGGWL